MLVDLPNGSWPNGLTLDMTTERVYWVDARLDTISSMKYDGSDVRRILQDPHLISHPFAIATFANEMFWSDWVGNQIVAVSQKIKLLLNSLGE